MFDEQVFYKEVQALYKEIIKIWGLHGSHTEVFRDLYMKANPDCPPPDWFYPKENN